MIRQVALMVAPVIKAFVARLLADEFGAWQPSLTESLMKVAVSWLRPEERDRYEEEWLEYVSGIPGKVGPIVACIGLLKASYLIYQDRTRYKWRILLSPDADLADLAPVMSNVLLSHFAPDATQAEMAGLITATKESKTLRAVAYRRYALLLDCLLPTSKDRWITAIAITTANIMVETKLLIHRKGNLPKINFPPY